MKRTEKLISFVLLFLSFSLIVADCSVFVKTHTFQILVCNNCQNISGHIEHSHGAEEGITLNETKSKMIQFFQKTDVVLPTDIALNNNFISKIWQPPKLF